MTDMNDHAILPRVDEEPMSVDELHSRFVQLIDEYARRNLTNPSHPRTIEQRPETIGLMIASAFGYDANVIYRIAGEALEDSNFHDEAAKLRAYIPKEDIEGYEEGKGLTNSRF